MEIRATSSNCFNRANSEIADAVALLSGALT
jgi:hypothetical protein